jgi:hypothetical protein
MKMVDFIHLWHMPLLFVVAGAASGFALGAGAAADDAWASG